MYMKIYEKSEYIIGNPQEIAFHFIIKHIDHTEVQKRSKLKQNKHSFNFYLLPKYAQYLILLLSPRLILL